MAKSKLEDLLRPKGAPDGDFSPYVPERTPKAAPGFETPLMLNDKEGWLVTNWRTDEPTEDEWDALLAEWLSPKQLELYQVDRTHPVAFNGWEGMTAQYDWRPESVTEKDGKRVESQKKVWKKTGNQKMKLKQFKCRLMLRVDLPARMDVDQLCKQIMKRRPIPQRNSSREGVGLVVCLADWQYGKGEGGGSIATAEFLLEAQDQVAELARDLRPEVVWLAGLGDMVEGCTNSWYPYQLATIDLDATQQERAARRTTLSYIDRALSWSDLVKFSTVPSNHGENRNGKGNTVTDPIRDNRDIALAEQVAEIMDANPDRYDRVQVIGCDWEDPMVNLVDVAGVACSSTHGHQLGSGQPVPATETWWKGHGLGSRPVAQAQLLFTGHRHHFACSEQLGRTMFQAPASDGGSEHYTNRTGHHSPRGLLAVEVGTAFGKRGWGAAHILH